MNFDRSIQKNFQETLEKAIQANPSILEKLALIQEDHNERNANTKQGNSYFKLGDRVGLRHDWGSLGTIEEIRQTEDGFTYLVAWLSLDERPTGDSDWVAQEDLTL